MSDVYYGVAPSSDFFAHYGVKGMKWGVRRAIEKGSTKKLSRQYSKASKKLAKLSERADVEVQKARYNKFNKASKASAKVGTAALGTLGAIHGAYNLSKLAGIHFSKKQAEALNLAQNSHSFTAGKLYKNAADHYGDYENRAWHVKSAISDNFAYGATKAIPAALLGTTIGSYGYAVSSKIKANKAKKRTTPEGHARAVSEKKAWKNEMDRAFKGTKYEGHYGRPRKNKRRR